MSAQQIEIINREPAQPAVITPMEMLGRAVERGADIATIERLAALAERMEMQRARRDFDEAISSFKSVAPRIVKGREIKHGEKLISRYEDMAAISKAIDPVLAQFGLSYRFRTDALDKAVKVTCVISHKSGHSEENSLTGPHDAGGAKNAIQAIGSSVTYLQRYTLKSALGLAATDDDDGGASGRPDEVISDDEASAIDSMLAATRSDKAGFLKYFRISEVADLPKKKYDDAVSLLQRKARANV